MKEDRVSARLPEFLKNHVHEVCDELKRYDSASEYIRDLIRRDYDRTEQEKIMRLNARLAPLLNRPLEEFTPFDAGKDLEEIEREYLAEKEAQQ